MKQSKVTATLYEDRGKPEGNFGVSQGITKDISTFQFLIEQASRQGCSQSTGAGIGELKTSVCKHSLSDGLEQEETQKVS
jgi:hypothetical protein